MLAPAAPPAPPAAVQTPAPQALAFKGATLGLTLAQWKAAPFPAVASHVAPICSNEAGAARVGLSLTAAEAKAGAQVCTYAFIGVDGPTARKPVPIRDGLMATHVRYVFENDRLVEIGYTTSADAFDDILARISSQIGKPVRIDRDVVRTSWGVSLPRVRVTWRSPAGSATLVDPTGGGGRLAVTYSAPGVAQAAAATAA